MTTTSSSRQIVDIVECPECRYMNTIISTHHNMSVALSSVPSSITMLPHFVRCINCNKYIFKSPGYDKYSDKGVNYG